MTKNHEPIKSVEPVRIDTDNTKTQLSNKLDLWIIYYAIVANAITMMSTDIHLPSLPAITKDLNTTFFASQLILIVFYTVGIFARIVLGPLSDVYGRRRIMLFALDVQVVGQAMQTFTPNIEIMLCGRVIQALASGGLTILISAIISDLFEGRERTKMLSFNEFMQSLSFVVAPLIGGFIAIHYGWRGGFLFLLVNIIIARVILSIYMVETNFTLKKLSFTVIFSDYKQIINNRQFMTHNLIMAFIVAAYMMYTVGSSYIYIVKLGLPVSEFAYFQALPLLCQALVAMFYTKLNMKLRSLIKLGVFGMLCTGFSSVLVIIGYINYNKYTILLHIMVVCTALALVFPACLKRSLDLFPEAKGTASSMIVVTRGIFGGIGMIIAGVFQEQNMIIFYGILFNSIMTFISWLYIEKK